ncbi:hypothetical protein B0H17DRAFT_854970, partial [Mycena rosella]
ETIAAGQTTEEATEALYGLIPTPSGKRVGCYVASICQRAGRIDARAGFGIFWGRNNAHNIGRRISGQKNDARAILMGLLGALSDVPQEHRVDIYTTSKYAIRSLCYWASANYTRGWDCANGDLLESLAHIIRRR